MGGVYMGYLEALCRRRGWPDPVYGTYQTSSGFTCAVIINGHKYQNHLSHESYGLAKEDAAMRAFMAYQNFYVNSATRGLLSTNSRGHRSREVGYGSMNCLADITPSNIDDSWPGSHNSGYNSAATSTSAAKMISWTETVKQAPHEHPAKTVPPEMAGLDLEGLKLSKTPVVNRGIDALIESIFLDTQFLDLFLEAYNTISPKSFQSIFEVLMDGCIQDAKKENKFGEKSDFYHALKDCHLQITKLLTEHFILMRQEDRCKAQEIKMSEEKLTDNEIGPFNTLNIIQTPFRTSNIPEIRTLKGPNFRPNITNMYADIIERMISGMKSWIVITQRDGQSFSAVNLSDALENQDAFRTRLLLEYRFTEVATGKFAWIVELSKLGYSPGDIADELLEKSLQGPWIHETFKPPSVEPFQEGFHLAGCLHYSPTVKRKRMHANYHRAIKDSSLSIDSPDSQLSIRESIEYLCGLGGVRPAANEQASGLDCVTFQDNSTTAIISPKISGHLQVVQNLQQILGNLEGAVRILQRAGGCCDSFTFLAVHGSHIQLRKINLILLRQLFKVLGTDTEDEKRYQFLKIWTHLFGWVEQYQLYFDYCIIWNKDEAYAWCLVVQFMSLALLSYSQAHIGPLRPFFLDTAQNRVVLVNCNNSEIVADYPCIVGSLVELTCMGEMTEQPVFAFRFLSKYSEAALYDTMTRKYDLMASPENLLDTWGPGEFVADVNDSSQLFGISIGGGSITSIEDKGETVLHWSRQPLSKKSLTKSFHKSSEIMIGARVLENFQCQADTKKQMNDAVAFLEELGTFPSYWEVRERQIGLGVQGGQTAMAAFQFNQTWVKMRGLSKKSTMLIQQSIYITDLESIFGVQVSVCTGIARRVRLCELLADVLPAYVGGLVTTPRLWDSLYKDLQIIDALRGANLKTWLSNLDHDHQEAFESLVTAVLFLLQDTGVDRKGQNFVIAFIQPDLPFQCFKVPCKRESYWARMLADSEDIATFAYITTRCLETTQVKCRGPRASWANTTGLLMTAVSCYQERVNALASSTAQWVLKHSEVYLIGNSNSPLFVEVDKPDNEEPRLLVSLSTIPSEYLYRLYRKGKPGKPRRLREKKASDQYAESVTVLMS